VQLNFCLQGSKLNFWPNFVIIVLQDKFVAFDTDRSGNIDTYELMNLFQSIGMHCAVCTTVYSQEFI